MRILHDRVLLRIAQPEEKTSSGIVLTNAVEPTYEAIVLAVGPGKTTKEGVLIPLNVKVNDKVIYNPKAGSQVKVDGETLLVTIEEEIFCVLDNDV